ncbi:MAG: hypothetical protein JSW37_05995, partial [Anaerolineales bacterium]
KRNALPLRAAGLVGSTLAMVLMVRAPGNRVRQAYFPATPGLRQLAKWSLGYALQFVSRFGTRFPLTAALSLVLPALLAYKLHSQDLGPGAHARTGYGKSMPLVLLPVAGFILIVCCFVPVIYGTSSPPVDRVLVIPQFVLVCVAVCWAFLAGLHLRQCEILGRTSPLFYIGALAGLCGLAAGILATPAFVADHLSPDGVLDSALVREISELRLWAAVAGGLLTFASVAALVAKGRELPPGFTTTCRFLLMLVIVALISFGPVWSAWRTIAAAPGARAYASRWDELDREIRAGKASPTAMAELTLDSGYGLVDSWAAQYYDALLNADKSSGIR